MSHTLAAAQRLELEVKKSRFIAHALPAATPESALAELARVSDPGATHNCWAYRIGAAYRSSADGEPAGTTPNPIANTSTGATATFTFTAPGLYPYRCMFHQPGMAGVIEVR